jgi:hypothetical protein
VQIMIRFQKTNGLVADAPRASRTLPSINN